MDNYKRFMELYNQIQELIDGKTNIYSQNFRDWHRNCTKFLIDYYGRDSIEVETFSDIFSDIKLIIDTNDDTIIKNASLGLIKSSQKFLDGLIDEIKNNNKIMNNNNIFIVHGHDGELKYKIKDLLTRLGLNPIVLHEQVNSSQTIIEKIEKYGSEAQAAIILM